MIPFVEQHFCQRIALYHTYHGSFETFDRFSIDLLQLQTNAQTTPANTVARVQLTVTGAVIRALVHLVLKARSVNPVRRS